MNIEQALILSIVEGVSEFLPISSTGHLVLASTLLKIPQTEFVKSFEIIIQLGAILSVVFLYWKTLIKSKTIWLKILAAFLPTAFLGLIFYETIKTYLLGNPQVTTTALFLGGIAIALFAAYFFVTCFQFVRVSRIVLTVVIGIFLSLTIRSGVLQVHSLYNRSNLVTDNQITALQVLRDTTPENTVVYSHTNGVSQTSHDVMIAERSISHFSTFYCEKLDVNCQAFNDPMNDKSKRVFITNGVQYFLFMKPSVEGSEILDRLIRKYRSPNYSVVYQANDVWLFQMK